jgi:MFS family permease
MQMIFNNKSKAIRFIVFLGCISLFADMTYEGARSINGPYLQVLGASGTVVGVVAGLGELIGYGLRILSGYLSDRTKQYWVIMFAGYSLNLLSVPILAWAGYWQVAFILIIAERAGKAIRNPTRDAMLSHASSEIGHGWGFGLHEFMDQLGATIGPLLVSLVLYLKQDEYSHVYIWLFIPACCALLILLMARINYPHPQHLEVKTIHLNESSTYPRQFFLYAAAAMFIATGYADYPLIAYHFKQQHIVSDVLIPILYAIAMLTEGLSGLLLGKIFDRKGVWTLLEVTVLTLFFAPLVFLFDFKWAVVGIILWGLGMGAQGSILKALIAGLIPASKRATAFGLFDTLFGVAWFGGSAVMGYLYDRSIMSLVVFSIEMQVIAIILLAVYIRKYKRKVSSN